MESVQSMKILQRFFEHGEEMSLSEPIANTPQRGCSREMGPSLP